jgi:hypothetical protein
MTPAAVVGLRAHNVAPEALRGSHLQARNAIETFSRCHPLSGPAFITVHSFLQAAAAPLSTSFSLCPP